MMMNWKSLLSLEKKWEDKSCKYKQKTQFEKIGFFVARNGAT